MHSSFPIHTSQRSGINGGLALLHLSRMRQVNWDDIWRETLRLRLEQVKILHENDQVRLLFYLYVLHRTGVVVGKANSLWNVCETVLYTETSRNLFQSSTVESFVLFTQIFEMSYWSGHAGVHFRTNIHWHAII